MSWNLTPILNKIQQTLYNESLPGGRIPSVIAIGNTWLDEVESFPYCYVDIRNSTSEPFATRQHKVAHNIVIGLAYKSNVSNADAHTQIRLLTDDGNGNGLLPILSDPANFSWGQLAAYSGIKSVEFFDKNTTDTQAPTLPAIVYCVVVFEVWEFPTITGQIQ